MEVVLQTAPEPRRRSKASCSALQWTAAHSQKQKAPRSRCLTLQRHSMSGMWAERASQPRLSCAVPLYERRGFVANATAALEAHLPAISEKQLRTRQLLVESSDSSSYAMPYWYPRQRSPLALRSHPHWIAASRAHRKSLQTRTERFQQPSL